jgi:hypothetical protein
MKCPFFLFQGRIVNSIERPSRINPPQLLLKNRGFHTAWVNLRLNAKPDVYPDHRGAQSA